jgi:hypothetical protein
MPVLPFIEGLMPLQALLELAGLVLLFSAASFLVARAGWPINRFAKALILLSALFVYLKFRIYPPMPFTILATYLVVGLIGILLWASSSEEYWREFRRPIVALLDAQTRWTRMTRTGFMVFLPLLGWWLTWNAMILHIEEPVELRTVGPAPPQYFTVHGERMDILKARNPYRVNQKGQYDFRYTSELAVDWEPGRLMKDHANPWDSHGDPYLTAALEGGKIYFQECVFCHGGNLNGRGIFAPSMNPIPINFTDPGTIAQLTERYVFWRTAIGGLNLPREGFPWASTMPRMEEHLSTSDIWKVVLFEYWHTGWIPRSWEDEDD